jgi:hypothetical protein
MRFWWQRKSGVAHDLEHAKTSASGPSESEEEEDEDPAGARILDEVDLLGRFAWRSYQEKGRGLLLFKVEDLTDPEVELAKKLEYFTLAELTYVSEAMIAVFERHVGSYEPETEFTVALFGDSVTVRVVVLDAPLSEL